jgi:hypothetical protein
MSTVNITAKNPTTTAKNVNKRVAEHILSQYLEHTVTTHVIFVMYVF